MKTPFQMALDIIEMILTSNTQARYSIAREFLMFHRKHLKELR